MTSMSLSLADIAALLSAAADNSDWRIRRLAANVARRYNATAAALVVDALADERLCALARADVRAVDGGLAARCGDLVDDLLRFVRIDVVDDH